MAKTVTTTRTTDFDLHRAEVVLTSAGYRLRLIGHEVERDGSGARVSQQPKVYETELVTPALQAEVDKAVAAIRARDYA